MKTLKLAFLAMLMTLLHAKAGAVNYEVSKNTSMQDDQGGSFTTSSTGSLSEDMSLVTSSTTFTNFLFRERPHIVLEGDLSALLSGTQANYSYSLDGLLDITVEGRTHAVNFDNLTVSRRGMSVELGGVLLVDGAEYEVRKGSLAEEIIVTLILLQGQ